MITMFDNIAAASIPADAQACAGYVDGTWPDADAMRARFPHLAAMGRVLTISTQGHVTARCLDIERGNPTPPSQAPAWLRDAKAAGEWLPIIYANLSTMGAVQAALGAAGLKRGSDFLLWVADWTFTAHLPTGYDACQWTDRAGPNDESLCLDHFFPADAPPLARGLANAGIHFDLSTGGWKINPLPGTITLGPARWASAEVQMNEGTGEWRVQSMPWNAPPLGG